MPEIWLSYGGSDVAMDVRAENLGQRFEPAGEPMAPEALAEAVGGLEAPAGAPLAALHATPAVAAAISAAISLRLHRSEPAPEVLARPGDAGMLRGALPDGARVGELPPGPPPPGAVPVAEMELDGLFGYETVATRLLRLHGPEGMLGAYARRAGAAPAPGQSTPPAAVARTFADGLECECVELVGCPGGAAAASVGHPAKTAALSSSLEAAAVRDAEGHKSVVVSAGKPASSATLARALASVWNCRAAAPGGLAVLVAECGRGLGSEAARRLVEGRLDEDGLRSPAEYVDGMEGLLHLADARRSGLQVALASVLPEAYARKLGIVPLAGAGAALAYALEANGPRHKVAVVEDGARTLLR